MLVKFVIDPEAIDDTTNQAHTRRLLKVWEHCGLLVYPTRAEITKKCNELKKQTARKLWDMTFAYVRRHPLSYRWLPSRGDFDIDWDNAGSDCTSVSDAVLAVHHNNFKVALVGGYYAELLDIPEGGIKDFVCRCKNKVEGVRLSDADQSKIFEHAGRRLSYFRENKPVMGLWQEWFQSFAECSKDVVIVDQYTVGNDIEGLFRFLRLLGQSAKKCDVTIYSALPGERKREEEIQSIEKKLTCEADQLKGQGIKNIRVFLFSAHRFSKYAHDRHIRFDNNVFHIGRGMRVFKFDEVKELTVSVQIPLEPGEPEEKEDYLDKKLTKICEFSF